MTRIAALTGATGFLGGHIAAALSARGWRLRLLTRRPDATLPPNAETIVGALDDGDSLRRLVAGADAVIHAAGLIRAPDAAGFRRTNVEGTERLAAAVRARAPAARLLVVSSLAAREPALSDYAASKQAAEDAARRCGPEAVSVVRPCAVYGPGDRETLRLFRAARRGLFPVPPDPGSRVCLVHARDAADAVAALCAPEAPAGTFEVTDARAGGYAWAEIAAALGAAVGGRARPFRVPPGVLRLVGALAAARATLTGRPDVLGPGKVRELLHPDWSSSPERQPPAALWRASVALEAGAADTAAWYRRVGWL